MYAPNPGWLWEFCMTMGKALPISGPQFFHCLYDDLNNVAVTLVSGEKDYIKINVKNVGGALYRYERF